MNGGTPAELGEDSLGEVGSGAVSGGWFEPLGDDSCEESGGVSMGDLQIEPVPGN